MVERGVIRGVERVLPGVLLVVLLGAFLCVLLGYY